MGNASSYWGGKKGYAPNWYSFCAKVINERVTGAADMSPTIWALQRNCPLPASDLLEIGCLDGRKLGQILDAGLAANVHGVDIAEAAIARGRADNRLRLNVMDLNAPALPAESFDVILANGVLHHIANLDACVQNLYDALRPGGAIVASEFTGPQRYAYSRAEVDAINEGKAMLPDELRGALFHPDQLASKLAADPSEAIRTRDIGAVLAAAFDDVNAIPYGGNVLMRALSPAFFSSFDAKNIEHVEAVDRLVAFDAEVAARRGSHHHYFIVRKT